MKTLTCNHCSFRGLTIPDIFDGYICLNCGLKIAEDSGHQHTWVYTREGRTCRECYKEDRGFMNVFPRPGENHAKGATYKRIFYFHEKLSQFNQNEPEIPEELLELLDTSAESSRRSGAWERGKQIPYQVIREICKNVSIDSSDPYIRTSFLQIRDKYRSQKFKKKEIKDLLKYAEKWVTLNCRWSGVYPPCFTHLEYMYLHDMYVIYDRFFESVRHSPLCPQDPRNNANCHKSFKCRYAMVSINLLIRVFMEKLLEQGRITQGRFNEVMIWWPQLAPQKTEELKCKYLDPIQEKINSNRSVSTDEYIQNV